jgi:chorismate dehydratase
LHAKVNELDKRIRVGAVSYLNTKPLLYGVKKNAALLEQIALIEDYPASIANMLLNDEIDVGLIPVAVIPKMKASYIITDYCIGAENDVASVCLFSEKPIEEITHVLLDYQSRTSVNLAKVLLKHYWKKEVIFVDGGVDFRAQIKGTTAGVVIGDRALEQRKISPFIYDLAGNWIKMTGLPFVFAAWIANKPLNENFIAEFNKANALGIEHLNEVLAQLNYSTYNLHTYYTQNISYELTDNKRKGLELFLSLLKTV